MTRRRPSHAEVEFASDPPMEQPAPRPNPRNRKLENYQPVTPLDRADVEQRLGALEPFDPRGPRSSYAPGAPRGNKYALGHGGPKICTSLRHEILQAAARSRWSADKTLQGYLVAMCEEYPRDYFNCVARLAPIHVQAAIATFDSTQDIKQQLLDRGIKIDRIFDQPRISKPLLPPRPEPVDNFPTSGSSDEHGGADRPVHDAHANGACTDVRNHEITIMTPGNGAWHELNDQMPLPLEDTE
jgi:hypothetical protein